MSNEGKSADAALKLKREGHEVVFWIRKQQFKSVFDGLLHKADHWGHYLDNERVVVFDSVGGGKTADRLRRQGFRVWGATEEGDMKSAEPSLATEMEEKVTIDYKAFLGGELVFSEGLKVDVDWLGGRAYLTVEGVTRQIEEKRETEEKGYPVCMTFIQTETKRKAVGFTTNLPVAFSAIQVLGKNVAGVVSGEGEFEDCQLYAFRLPIYSTKQLMSDLNFPSDYKDFYHFANIAVVDGHITMTGPNRKLVDLVTMGDDWSKLIDEVLAIAKDLPFKEKVWKEPKKEVVESCLQRMGIV